MTNQFDEGKVKRASDGKFAEKPHESAGSDVVGGERFVSSHTYPIGEYMVSERVVNGVRQCFVRSGVRYSDVATEYNKDPYAPVEIDTGVDVDVTDIIRRDEKSPVPGRVLEPKTNVARRELSRRHAWKDGGVSSLADRVTGVGVVGKRKTASGWRVWTGADNVDVSSSTGDAIECEDLTTDRDREWNGVVSLRDKMESIKLLSREDMERYRVARAEYEAASDKYGEGSEAVRAELEGRRLETERLVAERLGDGNE